MGKDKRGDLKMKDVEKYLVVIRDEITNKLGFDCLYNDEQTALKRAEELDGLVVRVRRPASE
jgi:hypothetical protein